MKNIVEHDLEIECLFFQEYYFTASAPKKWATQSFPVLAMLTSGKGRLALDDKVKTIFPFKLHQPFFLPANLKRRPHVESSNEIEILAFGFRIKISNGIDLSSFLEIPMFFQEKTAKHLCELMLELYSLKSTNLTNWFQVIASKKRICDEIIENIIASTPVGKETIFTFMEDFYCTPAVQYLNKNFMNPLDISKLMKLCNLSRTHFFRMFKKQANSTPFEYIKKRRLQESQNMLLCTNLSVCEIGDHVGWTDQFHFSRIFKKETGLSPNNYRQQFKKK